MKNYFATLAILLGWLSISGFTVIPPSTGTLYIKIKSDGNKGNIHVTVRNAGSAEKLVSVDLAPGQSVERTLTGLDNGPQRCYLVSFDWPPNDFHNMSASAGNTIAWGVPVNANNAVLSWQIAGTGAFGSIPVFLP
jgi:hypothetical protein